MKSRHDLPGHGKIQHPLLHALRFTMRVARVRERAAILSLAVWLLCVAGFAVWTLFQYQVPAGDPWIGMTIHTSVFAFWLLVAREWLLIQVQRSSLPAHKQDAPF